MIYSAGDLGVEIDLGPDTPGMILQRKESDIWYDYLIDGDLVVNPFDVDKLPPGYCLPESFSFYLSTLVGRPTHPLIVYFGRN